MGLITFALIGMVAGVAFVFQMGLREKKERWVVDFASIGVVVGLLAASLVALAYLPNLNAGLVIWGSFNPHVVFIMPWSVFALTVLRKRYGPVLMLPALALLYGLSEVFFNSIAAGAVVILGAKIDYFGYPAWQLFFLGVLVAVGVGYRIVKPKFVLSPVLFVFAAWCLVWLATGIRSIDNSITGVVENLPFDLAWQANMFMFGTWVMKPR